MVTEVRRTPLPPPDTPPSGAELTRERLLQAAHELLYERGGGAVSVADICERAQANIAMVRYCFGNKDGLLLALATRITESFREELMKLEDADLEWRDKLERNVRAIARNYVRFPYINRLLMDQLRAGESAGSQALARSFAAPMADFYGRLLGDAAKSARIRTVDPVFLFFSIVGMCEFMFSAQPWLRHGFARTLDDTLVDQYADHVAGLVLHGITAPGSAR